MPSGMQRMVQSFTGTTSAISPVVAIALATGNAGRAYGLPGGRVEVGEPADLILCRAALGSPSPDAFDAIVRGDWLEVDLVLIGGVPQAGIRWTEPR
jgi:enamidase